MLRIQEEVKTANIPQGQAEVSAKKEKEAKSKPGQDSMATSDRAGATLVRQHLSRDLYGETKPHGLSGEEDVPDR